jgi:hypothetical protein
VGGRRSCRLVEEVKNITIVYNVKHYLQCYSRTHQPQVEENCDDPSRFGVDVQPA